VSEWGGVLARDDDAASAALANPRGVSLGMCVACTLLLAAKWNLLGYGGILAASSGPFFSCI
jgi:hypothetical protein